MSDQEEELDAEAIARYAHAAEVLEFGEPGGMMDHFATAVGGTFFLEFEPTIRIQRLPAKLGAFVLGDSREPKDTKGILSRVKDQVVAIAGRLATHEKPLSLQKTAFEDLDRYRHDLNEEEMILLRGTIRNRDVTLRGRELLLQDDLVHQQLGDLLNEHEAVLRDALRISTRKIDRMLDAAMSAGALGGKINGSGGGGCMFAYAPEHPEAVAEAIERAGGTAWIVHEDEGTRTEPEEVRA
jgi:galactokinase